MRDFSIDLQSEKIYSHKTKEYFAEVVKSYYNESYRSAVVMLYSIVVADLVYKTEELKELYNDASAIEILNEIGQLQERNPNSPEWETKFIELIKTKTNLLEPSDYLNITTLQKHRHLCAHPVLTQSFELYRPNKETTRAHIRNMLEGVLLKPAFLSRKIFEDLLINLSSIKTIIYDEKQLENHLKAKYFNRFDSKIIISIFRSLWKVTFKLINSECDINREINLKTLIILLKNHYAILLETIEAEVDYYSDLNEKNLGSLVLLLNANPIVFNKLNDSAKILIKNIIEKSADTDTSAIFLSKDIKTHFKKILDISWESGYEYDYITSESILIAFNFALNEGSRELAFDFLIKMFGKSNQFDIADTRFDNLIMPRINEFTKVELKEIVKEINGNSQIYDRRKARSSNNYVRGRISELFDDSDFDFKRYTNFK